MFEPLEIILAINLHYFLTHFNVKERNTCMLHALEPQESGVTKFLLFYS